MDLIRIIVVYYCICREFVDKIWDKKQWFLYGARTKRVQVMSNDYLSLSTLIFFGYQFHHSEILHIVWAVLICTKCLYGGINLMKTMTRTILITLSSDWNVVSVMGAWSDDDFSYGPLARYVKLWVAHAPGMPGMFSPPPQVSDPDMQHSTCVTHVPSSMPGLLTSGFLWSWLSGKTFPAFSAHAQPAILHIWWEAHYDVIMLHMFTHRCIEDSSYLQTYYDWARIVSMVVVLRRHSIVYRG